MKNHYSGHRLVQFAMQMVLPVFLFFFGFCPNTSAQVSGFAKMNIKLLLNTNGSSSGTADGCVILYGQNFLQGIGPEDSYKFINLDENLASPCGNKLLSINGRPSSIVGNDTIPLEIWQYRQANYYLRFDATDFPAGVTGVLKDNYLQQDQDIRLDSTTVINFTLTADTLSAASNRFCIVLKPSGTLALDMLSLNASVKENSAIIQWAVNAESAIEQYEIERSGNAVTFIKAATVKAFDGSGAGQTHRWTDNGTQNGDNFYRIKTISKAGEVKYSKVLKVSVSKAFEGISVFPNPIKGNTIGFQISMEQCSGSVTLYNSNGQPVYTSLIQHMGGHQSHIITTGGRTFPKGAYTLLFQNGLKTYSKAVMID